MAHRAPRLSTFLARPLATIVQRTRDWSHPPRAAERLAPRGVLALSHLLLPLARVSTLTRVLRDPDFSCRRLSRRPAHVPSHACHRPIPHTSSFFNHPQSPRCSRQDTAAAVPAGPRLCRGRGPRGAGCGADGRTGECRRSCRRSDRRRRPARGRLRSRHCWRRCRPVGAPGRKRRGPSNDDPAGAALFDWRRGRDSNP